MDAAIDVLLPLATPSVTRLLVQKRSGRLHGRTAKQGVVRRFNASDTKSLLHGWVPAMR